MRRMPGMNSMETPGAISRDSAAFGVDQAHLAVGDERVIVVADVAHPIALELQVPCSTSPGATK